MPSSNKPKSALANLLDSVKAQTPLMGADVGLAIAEKKIVHEEIKDTQKSALVEKIPAPSQITNEAQLIYVNPAQCKPWAFADRPEFEMGDIASLAQSIEQFGQQEPVLIRPTRNDEKLYEVIFGNRRWRACLSIKKPLLAILKNFSDQEASQFQSEENKNREDLSDYARALSYDKQIQAGIYRNENELSQKLNISRQTLNDIMAYLRIPKDLVQAIPDFYKISRLTAVKLARLAKDKTILSHLIELGFKISSGEVNAGNLEAKLASLNITKHSIKNTIKITHSNTGIELFRIKKNNRGEYQVNFSRNLNLELVDLENKLKKMIITE